MTLEEMQKEKEEINQAINTFSDWMGRRMLQKTRLGFTGWQHAQNFNVKERLLWKAAKIATSEKIEDKDLIDIANFSMMLFMEKWKNDLQWRDNG